MTGPRWARRHVRRLRSAVVEVAALAAIVAVLMAVATNHTAWLASHFGR